MSVTTPEARPWSSTRAGRLVRNTNVPSSPSASSTLRPRKPWTAPLLVQAPTIVAASSGLVSEDEGVVGVQHPPDLGSHGGEHFLGSVARATSVATRRSAACSSA